MENIFKRIGKSLIVLSIVIWVIMAIVWNIDKNCFMFFGHKFELDHFISDILGFGRRRSITYVVTNYIVLCFFAIGMLLKHNIVYLYLKWLKYGIDIKE